MTPREYVRSELRAERINPDSRSRIAAVVAVKRRIAGELKGQGLNYSEIARAFGGVHHTSVMNWLGCFPNKRKGSMLDAGEPCTSWSDGKHQFVVEVRGGFETTQTHVKVCACGKEVERTTYVTQTVPLEVKR